MVMGLLNCRGEGDRKFFLYRVLNIAVEFGYVELVERLVELVDAELGGKVSGFFYAFDNDFEDIFLRGMGKRNKRIDYKSGCLYYYAFRDKLEPIELAAKLENVEMVNTLLACQKDPFRYTYPLHWAVKMRNVEVVNAILGDEEKKFDVNALYSMTVGSRMVKRYRCDTVFIGWDGSRIGPFDVVRFTPLQLATLIGPIDVVEALCNDPKGRLGATIENCDGVTALQIATEMRNDDVVKILTDIPEVAKDVKRLYRDRQVHVDAANAILVGAALISSVTFAGWLQPPLAYSPFFGSASLDAGAPPPSGMYPSFVSVEGHPIMKIFWVFNSLSFFFAIATLMVGATAARPPKKETYIGVVVQSLRTSLRLAYALLTVSVACVMGAFASAGFVVLPPIHSYTTVMRATVSIGVMVVFLAWTPSTVCKIVTSIQTRIQRRGRKIYYRYRPILAPIMKILDRIKKIVDLIKEKIQLD
ncbi:hypothetical protein BDL97_02G175200 [Sphagnum fallax]|nr:hypothetical protein BDL97_02G175200 [Sphagnum fallax]